MRNNIIKWAIQGAAAYVCYSAFIAIRKEHVVREAQ